MLKIYGRADSLNVRKVLWMADELALAYEREDWGRGFKDAKSPEFLQRNPFGLVPVVEDDGHIMRESHAIIRYLASRHGRADLYPTELYARQQVEAWMDWAGADTAVPLRGVFIGGFLGQAPYNEPWFIKKGRDDLAGLMSRIDEILQHGGPYITGGQFTIADIPLGLVVNRWFVLVPDGPKLAALAAYYDKLSERPGFMAHGRNGTP